jgi:predicted nucleic acid-binding protein
MSLNSIDTNVLIFMSKPLTDPDPRGQLARELVRSLKIEARSARTIVPAIVIAEYLIGIKLEDRTATLIELQHWVHIAPFDMRGAAIAADLMLEVLKLRKQDPLIAGIHRQCLKADVEVMATSIAHGARILYTTEAQKFAKIAGGKILIKDIGDTPQPSLFSSIN